ncbi:hypothetical protein EDD11_001027 [Mortierella claussenii]|nr:hypothetical protein EDD11_001027 [Mortierella claussenii]
MEWIGRRIDVGPKQYPQSDCRTAEVYPEYGAAAVYPDYGAAAVYPIHSPFTNAMPPCRTIYFGDLPENATIHDILNLIQTGNVEGAKLIKEKRCAFVSFINPADAVAFHKRATAKKTTRLGDQTLKIGWGAPSWNPDSLLKPVQEGATRCLFMGGVDDTYKKEKMMKDLSIFGTIEDFKIIPEKKVAFIHFTHVAAAIKAKSALPLNPEYTNNQLGYGKDRCGKFAASGTLMEWIKQRPPSASDANTVSDTITTGSAVQWSALTAEGRRTIYIGGLGPETTCDRVCNVIRGGALSKIHFMERRRSAFVTFADPTAAEKFMEYARHNDLTIDKRKVKLGWAKKALHLPIEVIKAFKDGACRNVYVGGLDSIVEAMSPEKLMRDFSEYGPVEHVNILREKNCAFVNFMDVMSAVKAVDSVITKPTYATLRIRYGKDRCGMPLPKYKDKDQDKEKDQDNEKDQNKEKEQDRGKD